MSEEKKVTKKEKVQKPAAKPAPKPYVDER